MRLLTFMVFLAFTACGRGDSTNAINDPGPGLEGGKGGDSQTGGGGSVPKGSGGTLETGGAGGESVSTSGGSSSGGLAASGGAESTGGMPNTGGTNSSGGTTETGGTSTGGTSVTYIDTPTLGGDEAVITAFKAAASTRVDFLGVGDSNQLFGGIGWDHGWQSALSKRLNMYATGLISPGENLGNGHGTGYKYGRAPPGFLYTRGGDYAAILAAFEDNDVGDWAVSVGAPHDPFPLHSNGETAGRYGQFSIGLEADCPINLDDSMTVHYETGRFANAEGGQMRAAIRQNALPRAVLVSDPDYTSMDGIEGEIVDGSITLPAASREGLPLIGPGLGVEGFRPEGKFWGGYIRWVNNDRSAGFSYHTASYRGGQSLRVIAWAFQNAKSAWEDRYFGKVRAQQGTKKRVIVTINSGLNDRSDTVTSVGRHPTSSSTAAGFIDNLEALVDYFEGAWKARGWDIAELFFIVSASHAISQPQDPQLMAYDEAARAYAAARDRVLVVSTYALADYATMLSGSWYYNPANVSHLSQAGYEGLADLVVTEILAP